MSPGPRALYLHGFGSGPASVKGLRTEAWFAPRGLPVERLDLRVPSLEQLRFSLVLDTVVTAIGGASERVVLFGSSLGGLAAAHVAARDPRVGALVLLAPAFGLAARWRAQNPDAVRRWEQSGWLEIRDHAEDRMTRVDIGFLRDVEAVDQGFPDVRVPTLVVHGTRDDTVPIAGSRAFAAPRPWVRLVEVDDGHELIEALPLILERATAHLGGWLPRGGQPP